MKKTISMVSSFINMMIRPVAEKNCAKIIFASHLPMAVKIFIENNFSGSIAFAEKKTTSDGLKYGVTLSDGVRIEFNENGGWEMVDCKMGMVPAALVPVNVEAFMDAYYPTTPIVKIQKNSSGFEVTLSNYITLKINNLEYTA